MDDRRRILALAAAGLLLSASVAFGRAPSSAPDLASARQSFAAALANAKAHPSKASRAALAQAGRSVREASVARSQALYAEVKTLGTDPLSLSRADQISKELKSLGVGPNFGPVPVVVSEVEPNGTPATATFLDTASQAAVIATGTAPSTADVDYYRFVAPANSKLWVFVNTRTTTDDSTLTLFAGDGVTELDFSDDDAYGTDYAGGGGTYGDLASALYGTPLTAGGTYFLAVQPFSGSLTAYDLLVVVDAGPGVTETEPNDAPTGANRLIGPFDQFLSPFGTAGSIGVANGRLEAGGGDLDAYAVYGQPGSVLYYSVDADPAHDGSGTADVVLELFDSTPTLIESIDFGGAGEGEVGAFQLTGGGPYYILVRGYSPTDEGPYRVLAALANDLPSCSSQTLNWTGRLGATSTFGAPGYLNFANFSKIIRTGTPSTCAAPKVCPGLQDVTTTPAQFYPIRNGSDQPQCVTVTVQLPALGNCDVPSGQIEVVAYGEQFDPLLVLRPCHDYLADLGSSPVDLLPHSFSFTVPPRSWFWLTMYDVDSAAPVCNQQVQFSVTGLPSGCTSDLSITKTGPATGVVGPGPMNYDVAIRNAGPVAAPAFQFNDIVPFGYSLTAITPVPGLLPGFACFVGGVPIVFPVAGGNTVTCAMAGPIPVGITLPVTFTYDTTAVTAGMCVTNTATLVQPTSGPFPPPPALSAFQYTDPNPSNDTSSATTCFGTTGNVGIVKLDSAVSGGGPDPVSAGRDLTYTIRVLNFGPADAAGIVVTDDLKSVFRLTAPNIGTTVPLRFKAIRKPALGGWTCTTPYPGTIGTVSCQSALLPAGIYDIGLVVTVPPVCPATPPTIVIRNTAVLSGLTDTDPLDNVATQDTTILPKPCFSPI